MTLPAPASAISSAEEVRKLRDDLDKAGKKLVFTNGCFDLLHAGHARYLSPKPGRWAMPSSSR